MAAPAIHIPSGWMVNEMDADQVRGKVGDSEKITINLGYVDLGQIDLMVREGFYSNRTDFIRTAIRNQLSGHSEVIKKSVARLSLDLGLRRFARLNSSHANISYAVFC